MAMGTLQAIGMAGVCGPRFTSSISRSTKSIGARRVGRKRGEMKTPHSHEPDLRKNASCRKTTNTSAGHYLSLHRQGQMTSRTKARRYVLSRSPERDVEEIASQHPTCQLLGRADSRHSPQKQGECKDAPKKTHGPAEKRLATSQRSGEAARHNMNKRHTMHIPYKKSTKKVWTRMYVGGRRGAGGHARSTLTSGRRTLIPANSAYRRCAESRSSTMMHA